MSPGVNLDHGKENGNYYTGEYIRVGFRVKGLCRDKGKENGNDYGSYEPWTKLVVYPLNRSPQNPLLSPIDPHNLNVVRSPHNMEP